MNISEHIQTFEQEMQRRNYAANTIDTYTANLKLFFAKSTKDHPKNINENDIKDFLNGFTEANTQRSYHSAIKLFYEICLKQKNKFKYIPYARKSNKLPIVLSTDEVQKMFTASENEAKPVLPEVSMNLHQRREQKRNKIHICFNCGADVHGWSSDEMQNCYLSCKCKKCGEWNRYGYWG